MNFKTWLESDEYQSVFPFLREEPPADPGIKDKPKQDYVKAASKGGRKTEVAAEKIVSSPVGSWIVGEEELLELVNSATAIPAKNIPPSEKYPNGLSRPEFSIAFAHVKGKEPLPNGKSRFRILAFWEGQGRLGKSEIMGGKVNPLGGIVYIGGHITDVWVAPDMRGTNSEGFSLYRKLREFAARRGIVGVAPGDDLTSKSYRASQARYDHRRASGEN